MIKKIYVRGYQSLYNVEIQLGRFTVIYGESDVGKSAFYRAIRGLLTSESGDSFISRGNSSCEVRITLDSGQTVGWLKKKQRSSEYVHEHGEPGQVVQKVFKRSRKLPAELANLLRISEIVVDGERFYPNLRSQFDSLFLLFESSGRRARVLATLVSDILLKGIRQANTERNRDEADIRSLNTMIDEVIKRESFDWEDLYHRIGAAQRVLQQVRRAEKLVEELRGLIEQKEYYERLTDFSFTPISEKIFNELAQFISFYAELDNLLATKHHAEGFLSRMDSDLCTAKDKEKYMKKKMEEIEKKLTFLCPHCKKPISMLEVDYE